jgi:hypothetical protein
MPDSIGMRPAVATFSDDASQTLLERHNLLQS